MQGIPIVRLPAQIKKLDSILTSITFRKMKYEYNFENATEKRESQKRHGRIDIPHDDPSKHPEHLKQHEHLQILQREALNGNEEIVRQMLEEVSNSQLGDTIQMIHSTVKSVGREIDLSDAEERSSNYSRQRYNHAMGITIEDK